MARLLQIKHEIWILGMPLYFRGPSGQMKVFVDRWFYKPRRIFKGRRAVLVVPMWAEDGSNAAHTVGMFRDALGFLGAELSAAFVAPGVGEKGAVAARADLLESAYRAGYEAVAAVVSSTASLGHRGEG